MIQTMTAGNRPVTACLAALALLGCKSAPVRPSETPAPLLTPRNALDSLVLHSLQSSVFRPGQVSYTYRSTSAIEATTGDSIPRIDSTQTTALLELEFQESADQQRRPVRARIDSIQVTFTNRSLITNKTTEKWPSVEKDVAISFHSGQLIPNESLIPTCTQDTREGPVTGGEILLALPRWVPRIETWADTTSREVCRGGIRLHINQVSLYRLEQMPAIDSSAYRIIRTTDSDISGHGTQWQQPVQAVGNASAVDTFTVTRATNRIAGLAGNSRLELAFRSPYRNQRFIQITHTEITSR